MRPEASEQIKVFKDHIANIQFSTNEYAYLISMKWLQKWYKSVGYYNNTQPTNDCPPIDNKDLLSEDGENRRVLMEGIHHFVVKKDMWDLFVKWYGGGPEIKVEVGFDPIRKQNVPDVHPLTLHIYYITSLTKKYSSKNIHESQSTNNNRDISHTTIQFSKYKSVDLLRSTVCEKLGIIPLKFSMFMLTSINDKIDISNSGKNHSNDSFKRSNRKKLDGNRTLSEYHISNNQQLILDIDNDVTRNISKFKTMPEEHNQQAIIEMEKHVRTKTDIYPKQGILKANPIPLNFNTANPNSPKRKHQHLSNESQNSKSSSAGNDQSSNIKISDSTKSLLPSSASMMFVKEGNVTFNLPTSTSMSFVQPSITKAEHTEEVNQGISTFTMDEKNDDNSDTDSESGSDIIHHYNGSRNRIGNLDNADTSNFKTFTGGNIQKNNGYLIRGPSKQIGICGFVNLGNTCFFNSSLQSILHTMPLVNHFLSNHWKSELSLTNKLGTKGACVTAFASIADRVWAGLASAIAPRQLLAVVQRYAPHFSGYSQQDAHELLLFLLDMIHEDLNRVKVREEIKEREELRRLQMKLQEENKLKMSPKTHKQHKKHKKKNDSLSDSNEDKENKKKKSKHNKQKKHKSESNGNESKSSQTEKSGKDDLEDKSQNDSDENNDKDNTLSTPKRTNKKHNYQTKSSNSEDSNNNDEQEDKKNKTKSKKQKSSKPKEQQSSSSDDNDPNDEKKADKNSSENKEQIQTPTKKKEHKKKIQFEKSSDSNDNRTSSESKEKPQTPTKKKETKKKTSKNNESDRESNSNKHNKSSDSNDDNNEKTQTPTKKKDHKKKSQENEKESNSNKHDKSSDSNDENNAKDKNSNPMKKKEHKKKDHKKKAHKAERSSDSDDDRSSNGDESNKTPKKKKENNESNDKEVSDQESDPNQPKNNNSNTKTEDIEEYNGNDDEYSAKAWNLYKSRNDSIIVDTFHGLLRSKIRCPRCKTSAVMFDPFVSISLPITSPNNLYQICFVPYDATLPQTTLTLPIPFNSSKEVFERSLFTEIGRTCRVIYAQVSEEIAFNNDNITNYNSHNKGQFISKSKSMSALSSSSNGLFENDQSNLYVSYSLQCSSVDVIAAPAPPFKNTKTYVFEVPDDINYCAIARLAVHVKGSLMNTSLKQLNDLYLIEIPNENPTKEELYQLCMKRFGYLWFSSNPHKKCRTDNAKECLACRQLQQFCKGKEIMSFKKGDEYVKVKSNSYGHKFPKFKQNPIVSSSTASVIINGKYMNEAAGFIFQNLFRPLSEVPHISPIPHPHANGKIKNVDYSKKRQSLEGLLRTFTSPTLLDEDNKWYCPNCKEFVCADKKLDIWSMPKCFIVHFKRFAAKRNNRGYKKIETNIDFDEIVDFSPFVCGQQSQYHVSNATKTETTNDNNNNTKTNTKNDNTNSTTTNNDNNNNTINNDNNSSKNNSNTNSNNSINASNDNNDEGSNDFLSETSNNSDISNNNKKMLLYKLYAVIHHNGQLNGGHYTMHSYVESQNKWFFFNDAVVKESTQQAAHQSSAYILFYQRIEDNEEKKS